MVIKSKADNVGAILIVGVNKSPKAHAIAYALSSMGRGTYTFGLELANEMGRYCSFRNDRKEVFTQSGYTTKPYAVRMTS